MRYSKYAMITLAAAALAVPAAAEPLKRGKTAVCGDKRCSYEIRTVKTQTYRIDCSDKRKFRGVDYEPNNKNVTAVPKGRGVLVRVKQAPGQDPLTLTIKCKKRKKNKGGGSDQIKPAPL